MKKFLWRAAPRVWHALSTPAAKRGSLAAEFGTLVTAVIFGLLYWVMHRH